MKYLFLVGSYYSAFENIFYRDLFLTGFLRTMIMLALIVLLLDFASKKVKKKLIRHVFALLTVICFSITVTEFAFGVLVIKKFIKVQMPSYNLYSPGKMEMLQSDSPFWADVNKSFGKWHYAKSYRHTKPCFDIKYTSNSYGARDKEREINSSQPRVVLLGDSFVEGYGVADTNRFSNLLEKKTKLEHLNFGISGGYPTSAYVLYKNLAKKFKHDAVIFAICPFTDYFEDDYERNRKYNNQYNPYWEGKSPNYKLAYFRKSLEMSEWYYGNIKKYFKKQQKGEIIWHSDAIPTDSLPLNFKIQRFLERFSIVYNTFTQISIRKQISKQALPLGTITSEIIDRWEYSLKKMREEAGDKPIALLIFPVEEEILDFRKNKIDLLSIPLENICKKYNIQFVNCYKEFNKLSDSDLKIQYLSCDGHWSQQGHQFISNIILNAKPFKIYQK